MKDTPVINRQRRRLGRWLSVAAASVLTAPLTRLVAATGECLVSPAQTEGPYFTDARLLRSDIRADPGSGQLVPGMPLHLTLRLQDRQCRALSNALVDIWHCDAAGVYSDVYDSQSDTRGRLFLRGQQISDANGDVVFTTIYPGWYPGRAVHIHLKVRSGTSPQQIRSYTSQLYFDEAVTSQVYQQPPYQARQQGRRFNEQDWIYQRGQGEALMLTLQPEAGAMRASATLTVVLR